LRRGREPINRSAPDFTAFNPGYVAGISNFWNWCYICSMIVLGTDLVDSYFADRPSHKGTKAARPQYQAWLDIVSRAQWRHPEDVKASYPKASILKAAALSLPSREMTFGWLLAFNIRRGSWRLASSAAMPSTTK
jgi:hypothetical protein